MTVSQLINEILTEWAFRVDDGMPNPKNPTHLNELGIVLSDMGLSHIKNQLIENLLTEKGKTPEKHVKEAEGTFTNPILNKTIKYKNAKGEDTEGLVGNLLRLPKDHPGRQAAERLLPPEGSEERDTLNKDLGGQNQPEKPEEPKGDKGGGGQQPQEDPIKKAAPMFDPKLDPAMGVRLDKEKETLAQLAKDAEKQDKESEKEVEPEKKDGDFNPIPAVDVQSEIPEADPDTFGGESDIPDGIDKEDLDKFNTDISKVQQIVADAKAKGEKAPNINLCQITVPGTNLYCDDNLGIPRAEMPQFKGKAIEGSRAANMPVDASGEVDTEPVFKEMLKEKGITVSQTEVPADKLKATQSELVGAKVVGMMGALEENPEHEKITAPIYVSRDGYVIDGHHRWAAIAAYNAAHPDSQIPMKVQVIDMDIKDAIPMCNKFAEDMGIAAKKADANKETPTEPKAAEVKPNEKDPESNVKSFKGQKSGKDIKTIEFEGGGMLFGTVHRNEDMVEDIVNQVKATVPKEKWKDIIFVGEGGATGKSGELEFNDEMIPAQEKFKEMGAGVDSFDGDALDVHKPESELYKSQEKQTGLSQSKIKAGNWASMIGQGEGTDTMNPNTFLDDEGKQFLQDAAKEAGFPPIQNWDNPSEQDKDTLYRLSFPKDNGDKETGVNDVQVAFNKARDLNIIKKQKELSAQGKIPVVVAGEGHADLVDDMLKGKKEEPKGTEKLPEPKEPSTKDGGVIYSIGGGYYSDTPGGPAQYVATESVVEKVLIEGDESLTYLLFEAVVNKTTARGKKVKVQTIDKSKQKAATKAAKSATTTQKPPQDTEVKPQTPEVEENPEGQYNPNDELQSAIVNAKNDKQFFAALDDMGMDERDLMLEEVQAGMGGPVASTGETLCCEAQTDLIQGRYDSDKIRKSKEFKNNLKNIQSIYNGSDKKKKNALLKELNTICYKMGYFDENGNPDYALAMLMYAEANTYIQQNLPIFRETTVARTKFKKEEDMVSWMKASFYSSYSLMNNGPSDWDRKPGNGRVLKANGRTDGAMKQRLLDGLKNAKTPEEKAHYEKQLKIWEKFKGYHDTYLVYKNDKGFYSVYHISNKKSDALDDTQNNTTPETRLANYMASAREANLSPKSAKIVDTAQRKALQESADNDNIVKGVYSEIGEDDIELLSKTAVRLPSRSQSDLKDEYYSDLKNDKLIKEWYRKTYCAKEPNPKKFCPKAISAWKKAKPNEIVGLAINIANEIGDLSKLSGNFTKFLVKQGQLAQSIFDKAEKNKSPKEIAKDLGGKYSVKEIEAILASPLMRTLADKKAEHAAGLAGVHRGFITSLHKADGTKPGHSGKNGPAVQVYVAGTLKSLHIDTYVTNYDGNVQIEMGGVGCVPSDVRNCMKSLSGFEGEIDTPEGRELLNKHLSENVKVDADSDAVYLVGNDGKTRTYLANDTWRQAGPSKKIATGFGDNLRKCLLNEVGSRNASKRNKKK